VPVTTSVGTAMRAGSSASAMSRIAAQQPM
jgi:hypothetical protein